MSAQLMGYFFDNRDEKLNGSLLLLALAIADHADSAGVARPGVKLLAEKLRLKPRQIHNLINRLERMGYLSVERSRGRGRFSRFYLKKAQEPQTENMQINAGSDGANVRSGAYFSKEKICNDTIENVNSHDSPPTPPYKENRLNQSERKHRRLRPSSEIVHEHKNLRPLPPAATCVQMMTGDTLLSHPGLDAIIELLGERPEKILWDDLIDATGSEPDRERLAECYRLWRLNGYRPLNFGWVMDWYVNGCGRHGIKPPGNLSATEVDFSFCDLCDDDGLRKMLDGVAKCSHPGRTGGAETKPHRFQVKQEDYPIIAHVDKTTDTSDSAIKPRILRE